MFNLDFCLDTFGLLVLRLQMWICWSHSINQPSMFHILQSAACLPARVHSEKWVSCEKSAMASCEYQSFASPLHLFEIWTRILTLTRTAKQVHDGPLRCFRERKKKRERNTTTLLLLLFINFTQCKRRTLIIYLTSRGLWWTERGEGTEREKSFGFTRNQFVLLWGNIRWENGGKLMLNMKSQDSNNRETRLRCLE